MVAVVPATPLNDGHASHVVPNIGLYSPLLHITLMIVPPPWVQPLNVVPSNVAVPEYPLSHKIFSLVLHVQYVMYFLVVWLYSGHVVDTIFVASLLLDKFLDMYPSGRLIVPWQVLQILPHVAGSSTAESIISGQVLT